MMSYSMWYHLYSKEIIFESRGCLSYLSILQVWGAVFVEDNEEGMNQ